MFCEFERYQLIPKRIPQYRKNGDGRGFAKYPGARGKREYFGQFDDPQSVKRYERWVARLMLANDSPAPVIRSADPDIATLSAAYLTHMKSYLNGQGDWPNVRGTQELLNEFAEDDSGSAFGPNRFREFQSFLVGRGLARTTVNAHMGRTRRFFRWCQSRELIPRGHLEDLKSVESLMPGRTTAPEPLPVQPIDWGAVAKTLPYLPPPVAAAVRVQYLCGMRPGEVVMMRAEEIDRADSIWMWKPARHKNSHRLQSLVKAIPVAAQSKLLPLIESRGPADFLFCPADAREWRKGLRPRKTKLYPCEALRVSENLSGRKSLPYYTESRYGKEIRDGIARANKNIQEESGQIPHWTPNQLRHAIASEVSALLGEQASQRWLGHSRLETTAIYTASHERELREIAAKLEQHLPQ